MLERLGIAYQLGGSYASALHGIPRQTHDIDLVIDPAQGSERAIEESLEGRFYADAASIARAIRERSSCNLVHLDTGVKVDLFVKSPEDTILRKLLWYLLGGRVSERQVEDARGIVGVQGERLDQEYLRRWAGELGIQDLLDEILGGE